MRTCRRLLLPVLLLVSATSLRADPSGLPIQTIPISYQIGSDTFEGCVSRPIRRPQYSPGELPSPGVLVAHDWTGFGPFPQARAEQLARLGYVALALDMYGKGIHAKNAEEAGKLAGAFYKDPSLFRARAQAALALLLKQPGVDPARIGAIGFCFGGATVLELARSGANVKGVVTFHGSLKTGSPAKAGDIKTQEILVLHGSRDPLVPPADVAGFMDEMNAARVPFRLVAYPNAVHAFTNPEAGSDPAKPTAYDPAAAEAAYGEMTAFFQRIFAR